MRFTLGSDCVLQVVGVLNLPHLTAIVQVSNTSPLQGLPALLAPQARAGRPVGNRQAVQGHQMLVVREGLAQTPMEEEG